MSIDTSSESIAVVGTGVAGLVAAHYLHPRANVTLFESATRVGGHVNTVEVNDGPTSHAIDTGFIVFNERNYVGFTDLIDELGIESQPSEMSFSFSSSATGLEYRGSSLNSLLAKRSNILRPSFVRMMADIPRFNRDAKRLIDDGNLSLSLREFLRVRRYSTSFVNDYLIPLGASIWSADPQTFADFPVAPLARFFDRHGLLSLSGRPQWRTITGGARRYVDAITEPLGARVRTCCSVRRIERDGESVVVHHDGASEGERFDRVILATHADTALAMLERPTESERKILGSFRFQSNRATLHTDSTLLPDTPRARASWNYRRVDENQRVPVLTYYANRLQDITSDVDYCITLNADDAIAPSRVIASFDYSHPVFDEAALRAQQRHHEIDGTLRTHYVGAYWGYGFHEDGVQSALRVTERVLGHTTHEPVSPAR